MTLMQGLLKACFIHSIYFYFWIIQKSAAPIATPTAIHAGSFVAAKTAAPIPIPMAVQVPALPESLKFLFMSNGV
tara:strand:+ start:164 stop:388 length:225 start_codon:yes stop_codon:yes gene_type:complete